MKLLKNLTLTLCLLMPTTGLGMKIRELRAAVAKGSLEKTQELLSQGVKSSGLISVAFNNIEPHNQNLLPMIQKLLQNGAEVTERNFLDAVDHGDTEIVQEFIKANILIPDNALANAIQYNQSDIAKILLKANAPLKYVIRGLELADDGGKFDIINEFYFFADKKFLQNYPQKSFDLLDKNKQEFITWLQKGADIKVLPTEQVLSFAPIAFTIPACTDELKALIVLLKKDDYKNVFTNTVIHDALIARNTQAFKILLTLIAQDRSLVNRIREELDKLENQLFADEMRAIIKQEVGKVPMKMPHTDVHYTFK